MSKRLVSLALARPVMASRNPSSSPLGVLSRKMGDEGKKLMLRKKWRDGEPVLSVETEDEFWAAVSTGEAVEVTRELGASDRFDGR